MKKYALFLLAAILVTSCKDEATTTVPDDRNLIPNPSFEQDGSPTLRSWDISGEVITIEDSPPGGGRYSARISEVWGPAGFISVTLPAVGGDKQYVFTCWGKTENLPAEIEMSFIRDSTLQTKSGAVTDTIWTIYSLADTYSARSGDSIKIILKGSISQLLPSKTFYDQCFLEVR